MKYSRRLGALALALSFAACKSREVDLTMVSTQMFDPALVERARLMQNSVKVEAEVYRHWIMIFPLGSKPTVEDALDKLMTANNGDVVVDSIVWNWWWTMMFYGRSGYRIEGRVFNTRAPQLTNPPPQQPAR